MICPECQAVNPDTQRFCGECGISLTSSSEIPASVTKTLGTPIQRLAKESMFAGRYRIIEELGRGGMGVVYKAEDTKLKRTVALKFLPTELTHVLEIKERFMREAQAAAALDHPNICTVHEFDEAEEKTFISMAYVKGQSLKKKIESGPLELDETLRITIQAAEGLREAHRQGIIHRDIKSANIMVDEREQVKIMDFGLARMTGGTMVTREGATMGTIAYMSPEQARGEEVDPRTDIWSLGVVLYEMLSGQLPFKGEHDQAVVYSILKEKPKPLTDVKPEIPMAIEQVLGKALEKNPEERYQQVEELIDDLKSISEGIEPEGIRARLLRAKLQRRKRAILYSSIAVFLTVATFVALSLFTGRAEGLDSIAVLPLDNLSGDPGQDYIAAGVHEALIVDLQNLSGLKRVIARPSVMRYRNTELSAREIAQELNVAMLLTGSVIREGEKVRVTAQLIKADTEENMWADRFEQGLQDMLTLQNEIVTLIAQEVELKLTPHEQARLARTDRVNPEALDAYLKGLDLLRLPGSQQTDQQAVEYLEKAVAAEPGYALAYAKLAQAYARVYGYYAPGTPERQQAREQFRSSAEKAVELDESMSEGYVWLAGVAGGDWDWDGAERLVHRAVELGPNNSNAHWAYSLNLSKKGKHEEAIKEAKRAVELDPFNSVAHFGLAASYTHARRLDDAIKEIQRIMEMWPKSWATWNTQGFNYFALGQKDRAAECWQKSNEMIGNKEIADAYKNLGLEGGMKKWLERATGPTSRVGSHDIAVVYAMLGDREQALAWLERAYRERHPSLSRLAVLFVWDPLRDDPRFQDLMNRVGFTK